MKDDGYRLSFSIRENNFYITDNLSGNIIIYNDGKIVHATLDFDVVKQHIKNIQEGLMTYTQRKLPMWKKLNGISSEYDKLIVTENEHFSWSLSYNGKKAIMNNNTFTYNNGFDKTRVLNMLNYVYATMLSLSPTLRPKRDIVRRIVDVGLLVWVYENNSVVVYEKNVHGNTMENCLVNGYHFPVVLVSSSVEQKSTTLFTSQLEELVTFPLDNSILTYYPPDEEAFN